MILTSRKILRRYRASRGAFWSDASVEASPLTRRSLREGFEAISGKPFATVDFGFDTADDWALGQRLNLSRLRREAPRYFAPTSAFSFSEALRTRFAGPIRDQLMGKSFIVPILKGPGASPSTIFSGSVA